MFEKCRKLSERIATVSSLHITAEERKTKEQRKERKERKERKGKKEKKEKKRRKRRKSGWKTCRWNNANVLLCTWI